MARFRGLLWLCRANVDCVRTGEFIKMFALEHVEPDTFATGATVYLDILKLHLHHRRFALGADHGGPTRGAKIVIGLSGHVGSIPAVKENAPMVTRNFL